ncbi:unnamed protein product, partial [Didymodactylos carnosus]
VYQVPLSAMVLLPFDLIIEKLSFFTSSMTLNSMIVISLSGFLVFIVNISLCWVIKNTSPLTFNVIRHIRTIVVLLGSVVRFEEHLNFKQSIGMTLTLFGLIAYTFVKMKELNQLPCILFNSNVQQLQAII